MLTSRTIWIIVVLWGRLLYFAPVADASSAESFVYTNNDGCLGNTVSGFSVGVAGEMTPILGSPFPTAGQGTCGGFYSANRIVGTAVRNLLFVSNGASQDVTVFSVDAATGVLVPIPGSPFPAPGGRAISVAITPDAKFLIAAAGSSVHVYAIADSGQLTPVDGSPFLAPSVVYSIKISPNGKFLAAGLPDVGIAGAVGMWSIGAEGTLAQVTGSPFLGASSLDEGALTGLDINCAGTRLFAGVANADGTGVNVFALASDGVLTPISSSPFEFPELGENSSVVALSPDDKTLFVSNQDSNTIAVFGVDAAGDLALVPGSPFPSGGSYKPGGMALDQAGKFLFVADSSKELDVFGIAGDGALTSVAGSPFPVDTETWGLNSLVAFPGKACWVPFGSFEVQQLAIYRHAFTMTSTFTLARESHGFDPLVESVTLLIGRYTITIPAGFFRRKPLGEFVYRGKIGDVQMDVSITRLSERRYWFRANGWGRGVDLAGTKNPVTVQLFPGTNQGTVEVNAHIYPW
ncbi:lactonase family protein [Methylococcus mesophilus]|uniref:lactonase family protein n=1 Tax=Methylococcus mesophilus TaxID=2993564 RepID=UPI00224A7763|nr:beta-propeller fold lactonase family protein [Methylococcus mesophilus]UZR29739.1 beta-propeller fold lactonase family protein [Methylococcus mesophilus]